MTDYTPYYFSAFKPFGYQRPALDLLYNYDYKNQFYPEILLSGAVGSAKSSLGAHWLISHCLRWRKARTFISRMGMPDLKKTIFQEVVDALQNDPNFKEGVHFTARYANAHIRFANGSEIIPITFGDKNWGKVKSYLFSGGLIEEATEYDDEFYEIENSGFDLLKARINRLGHVGESFLLMLTNPGDEEHYLYDYFIKGQEEHYNRFVFYSETAQNPYLDPNYVKQLRASYSKLMAERYLKGRWISLAGKGIYHAYDRRRNFRKSLYVVDNSKPIHLAYDFNVGTGKPMSACVYQMRGREYHIYGESIVDNSLWCLDCLEDLESRQVISKKQMLYVHGDATGNAQSANSKYTNYELIQDWLTHRGYKFEIQVPRANPPITTRHIKVNALCQNDFGQVNLFVYKTCPTLDTGLKLTKLKKTSFIEDDSKRYQHVTTALGYGIFACEKLKSKEKNKSTTYIRGSN